ncbi:hypothetical protein V502_03364, partial [Pseudogymnoascus sp. VKM F-4520 (FW-2644)]
MREVKDAFSSTAGGDMAIIFRIRHATRGYIWIETQGRARPLDSSSDGERPLLLTSRERPVYSLSRSAISSAGGPTDSDIWTKLSTSGLILYISTSSRTLLDRSPSALVGTSFQALLPPEQRSGGWGGGGKGEFSGGADEVVEAGGEGEWAGCGGVVNPAAGAAADGRIASCEV